MAAQQTARKQSRSKRDKKPEDEATQYEQELASYLQERIKPGLNKGSIPLLARSIAKELASRQRPDGASEKPEEQDEADVEPTDEAEDQPRDEDDDEPRDEAEDEDFDDEPSDEADDDLDEEPDDEAEDDLDDEPGDEVEDEPEDDDEEDEDVSQETEEKPDFEADMRELQAELGDEWVLTFSVKGDDAWLTAEKEDGSQHVEAQTADLLLEAVELLEEGGGRSG